jgi:DNA-binding FrmR family transcriptional regulator
MEKEASLVNYKKAQSLITKIIKMIEEGRYCMEIMQQNLAVIGLLRAAHQTLLEKHLKTCFRSAMESGNERRKRQMTKEILQVTKLFNK